MHQLRNVINRTNVPLDPQKNMNAAEDFMLLLLHAHVVSAAEVILSQHPNSSLDDVANSIIMNYVRLQKDSDQDEFVDKVCVYSMEVLTLGLLWHGFHDAIREGDGERILRYWRYLMVVFTASNNYNYAKEAVHLLLQYHYTLSERQKAQLLWSRCVNTTGVAGANIPGDLHMEHLNRRLKTVLRLMGANVTPKTVQEAGKAIAPVQHVCQIFEQTTAKYMHSNHHTLPSFGRDFRTVLNILRGENVFVHIGQRQHASHRFKCTLLEKLSKQDIEKKVDQSLKKLHFI